jgi:hypothetical protein
MVGELHAILVAVRVQRCKKVLIVGIHRGARCPRIECLKLFGELILTVRGLASCRVRARGLPTSENGAVAEGNSHPRADCFKAKRHVMSDEAAAVAFPRGTNQKHLRFGAKQVRLERSNATLVVSDGTLHRLKHLLLPTFQDKPLHEIPGKRQDENCYARYEAIHPNYGGSFTLCVALQVHALPCKSDLSNDD